MKKKLLVVGAHSGDFVWRAAGTIAKAIEEGASTLVIAMSYGERGESGELWKEDPKRSEESVKIIRKEQAQKAADIIGTPIQFLDWGDYPMLLTDERIKQLTAIIGDFEPTVIFRQCSGLGYYHLVQVYPVLLKILIRRPGILLNRTNRSYQVLYQILLLTLAV
jgi:LmbE family N-acetylglucosaminyl deacetylase